MLSVSMAHYLSVFLNMFLFINPLVGAIAVPGITPVESDTRHSKNTPPSNDFKSLLSPDTANHSAGNGLPRNVIEDIVITTSTSSSYLGPDGTV